MIISVTAPKKGMGQTQCSINMAAVLTEYIQGRVILADINKYSRDISYYFSDTNISKGLDNVISLIESGLLTPEAFKTCTKEINKNMDILVSNECFELKEEMIRELADYLNKLYAVAVIDTISGNNTLTREFVNCSDVIVVVLNQYKNVLDILLENNIYRPYSDKTVFIVNRYKTEINYNLSDIKNTLGVAGIKSEIFPIGFDIDMVNESNDHSVLNYILNHNSMEKQTRNELESVIRYILCKYGQSVVIKETAGLEEGKKRKGLFGGLFLKTE